LDKIQETETTFLIISDYTTYYFPSGIPLVYELNKDLKPIKHYYLASDEEVKAAIAKVAAQGKAKA